MKHSLKVLILCLLFQSDLFFITLKAQVLLKFEENFDSQISFSVSPGATWDSCSELHCSGNYSYRAQPPIIAGDSSVLITPFYDFSNYEKIYLVFDHICKISPEDAVIIEIRENYFGASWHALPSNSYIGMPSAYYRQKFSDISYPEWQNNDSLAIPDNKWWKTECFDVSSEASFSKVQFRFKIRKGQSEQSKFYYGWILDNVRLYAGNKNVLPPIIRLKGNINADNVSGTGEFVIKTEIAGKLKQLNASYSLNGNLYSANIKATEKNNYEFTIPKSPYESKFSYSIQSIDSFENSFSITRSFTNPFPEEARDSEAVKVIGFLNPNNHNAITLSQIPLKVIIKNSGIKKLKSATLYWEYGNLKGEKSWNGNLYADFTDSIYMGNIIVQSGKNYLKVYNDKTSDTLYYELYGCEDILKGKYTVGKNNSDFKNFEDLSQTLKTCGISGNCIFEIETGEYPAHLLFNKSINGMQNGDTVVFTSVSGKSEDVCLHPDSTFEEIIWLKKIKNVHFENISFCVDSNSSAYSAIYLHDSCSNIDISNCKFSIQREYAQGVTSASRKGCRNIKLLNNTFIGGHVGILFWGDKSHDYNEMVVENNIFERQNTYGLNLSGTDFINISNNLFISPEKNTEHIYTGLNLYMSSGEKVECNKFRIRNEKYACCFNNLLPASNVEFLNIKNNELNISVVKPNTIGIFLGSYCRKILFAHNSILLKGDAYSSKCVLVSGICDSIKWKNNQFINLCRGNSCSIWDFTKPIHNYIASHTLDYNLYYAHRACFLQTEYEIKSLKEWQALRQQDLNSVWKKISFADTSVSLKSENCDFICPSIKEVEKDIEGKSRNRHLSNMGAYHLIGSKSLDAMIYHVKISEIGDSVLLLTSIANTGLRCISNIGITYILNGIKHEKRLNINSLKSGDTSRYLQISRIYPGTGDNDLCIYCFSPNDSDDMNPGNDSLYMNFYHCDSKMSGTYTIGDNNADFTSIEEAFKKAKNCGISSPVNFMIQSGTYRISALLRGYIPGSNANNTLKLTSEAKDADSVILIKDSNDFRQNATICLSEISNLEFENISIIGNMSENSPFSIAFELRDSCRNIKIRNCKILVKEYETQASMFCGIYSIEKSFDSVEIYENKIYGGMYGIYLQGQSLTRGFKNLNIKNNTILKQYYSSIYLKWGEFEKIESNFIENIYFQGVKGDFVEKNRIHSLEKAYAIYMHNITPLKNDLIFGNNEVISNALMEHNAVEIHWYCKNIKFYHNTVFTCGKGKGSCLYLWEHPSVSNVDIKQNIFESEDNLVFLSSLPSGFCYKMSNNHYFSSGKNPFYCQTSISDISHWQTITFMDKGSCWDKIVFKNSSCLQIVEGKHLECFKLDEVKEDIFSEKRSTLTCKGCYPLEKRITDACIYSYLPSEQTLNSDVYLKIVIGNLGDSAIHNIKIEWQINEILQNEVEWNGEILKGDTVSILLGKINADSAISICAAIKSVNDSCDENSENDSLCHKYTSCKSALNGTYHIGKGKDFESINEAIQKLEQCGISGKVDFLISEGTYTGSFMFGKNIQGSNITNIIRFTGEDTSKQVILTLDSVYNSGNSVIQCINASNLIFDNLTIQIPKTQSNSSGISFMYKCENIEISNCNFLMQTNSYAAIYQLPGLNLFNINIHDNKINHGKYGILLQGKSYYPDSMISIKNNKLYYLNEYGICLKQTQFSEISNNDILQFSVSRSGFYGIYTDYVRGNCISSNKIKAFRGFYGMYLSNTWHYDNMLISNNEIIMRLPSTNCGIYIGSGCKNLSFYHNSIFVDGKGQGNCIYTAFRLDNINFKNNHFANYSGKSSSTQNYVIYSYRGNGLQKCSLDYNAYYSIGKNLNYAGADCDLENWKNFTGKDSHSVCSEPRYIDNKNNLKLSDYGNLYCPKLNSVDFDKENTERSEITSMGAYQNIPETEKDLHLCHFVSPDSLSDACSPIFLKIKVKLRNESRNTIFFDKNPLTIKVTSKGSISADTSTTIDFGYLEPMQSEIYTIMHHCPVSENGSYIIRAFIIDNEDTKHENDSILTIYKTLRTSLPFASNGNKAETEMKFESEQGDAIWYKDSTEQDIKSLYGKVKLCFPSSSNRGSIARLILHPIDLSGLTKPCISIWYAQNFDNKNHKDQTKILISVDGNDFKELTSLFRYNPNYREYKWTRYDIDLSEYSQACVRIAFEGISFGGGKQYIDSICIFGNSYLQVTNVVHPKTVDNCKFLEKQLKLKFANKSSQNLSLNKPVFNLHFQNEDESNYYSISCRDINLCAYSEDSLVFDSNFNWKTNKNYDFTCTYKSSEKRDDTLKQKVSTKTDLVLKNLKTPVCKHIGDSIFPAFEINNEGNTDIYNIPVEIQIDDYIFYDNIKLLKSSENMKYISNGIQIGEIEDSTYVLNVRIPLECDNNLNDNSLFTKGCILHDDSTNIYDIWDSEKKLLIYPNPSKRNFTLVLNLDKSENIQIEILNMEGQLISRHDYSGITGKNGIKIDAENFSSGIYICRIKHQNSVNIMKLIKL